MSFRDQTWTERRQVMGDIAENAFEQLFDAQWERYGLNRPDRDGFRVGKLARQIQYTPDYLCDDRFIEVQGVGRDQTLKLKFEKWVALEQWNNIMPVWLWVWDSHNERYAYFALPTVLAALGMDGVRIDTFPEGDAYIALPIEDFIEPT